MKIVKGFPSTSQNDYQLNVLTLVKHAARSFAKQEIVQLNPQGGDVRRTSYAEAYKRINGLANVLEGLGVGPGDRVGVLDWNTFRHYELYFGIPGLGAVHLQMNPGISAHDLSYIVNHSKPRLIFVDQSLIPVAQSICSLIDGVEGYVIMANEGLENIKTSLEPIYSYEDLIGKSPHEYNWQMIDGSVHVLPVTLQEQLADPRGSTIPTETSISILYRLLSRIALGKKAPFWYCRQCFMLLDGEYRKLQRSWEPNSFSPEDIPYKMSMRL